MKASVSTMIKTRRGKSTRHVTQARTREVQRFDYQNDLALIGTELRRLRKTLGHTIELVARAIKMSKYRLCRIEHGMYIHLGLPDLYRLAEYYGVSPLDILAVIPNSAFENLDCHD